MASWHGQSPASAEQLAEELKHPNADAIWNRTLEIFGDVLEARSWMATPRDLFDGRAPEQLVKSGDPAQQRRVL